MRPSGTALMEALTRGAVDGGADVTHIGMISTDALYFAVGHYGFDGGVMITASHNPAQYNGLKFCREEAQAISLDTGLGDIRDLALSRRFTEPARKGRTSSREILDDFGKHCVSFVRDPAKIKPYKIAIDAGNGMAGLTVPYVFKYLPQIEVLPLYFELDGTLPESPRLADRGREQGRSAQGRARQPLRPRRGVRRRCRPHVPRRRAGRIPGRQHRHGRGRRRDAEEVSRLEDPLQPHLLAQRARGGPSRTAASRFARRSATR